MMKIDHKNYDHLKLIKILKYVDGETNQWQINKLNEFGGLLPLFVCSMHIIRSAAG